MSMFLILAAAGAAATAATAAPQAESADAAALREMIVAGAKACAARDPVGVMAHYAPDIVLSYPGVPDQTYASLQASYRELCSDQPGAMETTTPTFEEIIVSGDMAVVRVIWSTVLRGSKDPQPRRLRDLQVWRRDGGQWVFARGVHYPLRPPAPAPAS